MTAALALRGESIDPTASTMMPGTPHNLGSNTKFNPKLTINLVLGERLPHLSVLDSLLCPTPLGHILALVLEQDIT